MSTDERTATKEGMVWQLYEWQQRQQFRHGSPTAPIYTGPNFTDSSSFRVTVEMPRSISVPPSPCEVPPSVPCSFKPLSPRRPHTPSDRRTVRPLDELGLEDSTRSSSPGNICAHLSQTSQIERRSVPTMGYITHTVSAPSLHGKTPEELTLLLIQLRRHQAKMAGVHSPSSAFAHLQHHQHNGLLGPGMQADDTYIQLKKDLEYLDLKVGPNKENTTSSFSSCSQYILLCCCLQHMLLCFPFTCLAVLMGVLILTWVSYEYTTRATEKF
ncbi:hypothetical protein XENOCAPTIV_006806 [Xenoophorus captivus]|uniref:Uncharacterized protein n=2 Tax=Goodeidae TaxID=28758 RepID=A0ABV0Q4H9_9TELE